MTRLTTSSATSALLIKGSVSIPPAASVTQIITGVRGEAGVGAQDAAALPRDVVEMGLKKDDLKIAKGGWIRPNKRVFDNAKISDHFAIIPTLESPRSLTEAEQKIYDLVVKRFLAIFFPSAEYLVTTRITTVEGHQFKTEGKVLVNPGWLAVYGKEAMQEQG